MRNSKGIVILAMALGLVGSELAWAEDYPWAASQTTNPVYSIQTNHAYLSDFGRSAEERRHELNERILGPGRAPVLEQQYQDLNRNFRDRRNYGLDSLAEREEHHKQMKNFSKFVVQNILVFQLNERMKDVEKNSEGGRKFIKGYDTVKKISRGNHTVSEGAEFKFGTKANIPSQQGSLWMTSNVVNGSVDVTVGDPWAYDPFSYGAAAAGDRSEVFRVNLDRKLPVWDLKSGLSYGGTSTNIKAKVEKDLSTNLVGTLESVRPVDEGASPLTRSGEHSVRFDYRVNF